jgi:uncharacterized membrane protein YphA (DoxX/SURF4 family)
MPTSGVEEAAFYDALNIAGEIAVEGVAMQTGRMSRGVFAAAMIVLGIVGLGKVNFTSIWAPVPQAGMPALAYLCAIVALTSGVGLLLKNTAAFASRVLFVFLLLWLVLFRLPAIVPAPTFGNFWPGVTTAVMLASAWVLYTWFGADWDRQHFSFVTGEKGLRIARVLFGLSLIFFGFAHFYDIPDTVVLIPGWLPWHLFWAYFTGSAFIVAGVAVLTGVCARLAAALAASQIGMFTLMIWVPKVLAGSRETFVWSETIVSSVLTACAWVMADSYRSEGWLSARRR